MSPATRHRLLKRFGPSPAGYTHQELHRLLDLLYGLFSHCYSEQELRQMVVSDPFDQSDAPRRLTLTEFAQWLEAILA